MGKISVFNFVTLNGFFAGPKGDLSWHRHSSAEADYAMEGLNSGNTLLFGRITYEHMAGFWPTAAALENAPEMAEGMNKADKIVFSKTLKKAGWNNTKLVRDLLPEIKHLKKVSEKNMTVLGSGNIVTQLAEAGLIDQYELMIDPVAIGEGTPIFNGIGHPLQLDLTGIRKFDSGIALLSYKPAKK